MNRHFNEPAIADWWLSFRNGNTEAFAALYKWFYPRMYAYGLKLISDNEQVQDIIQDLFMKLYTKPSLVGDAETLSSFLFAWFRNACINYANNHLRRVDIETVSDFELSFDLADNMMETQEEEQVHRRVKTIINSLTPRQREIIYLRFMQQLDYKEISRIMHHSSQAATYNLIHRALEQIRKKIWPIKPGFSDI
jgi:RNA polymerase sigma factor (sigma-70 family)